MRPRLLPIVYVIIAAALMALAKVAVPAAVFTLPYARALSVLLLAFGVLLIAVAADRFRRAGTTVNPLTPERATTLVTDGVYRFSRNPMYVGFLLFLLAWSVYLGSVVALLGLPLFVLCMTTIQIKPEQRALERHFGERYRAYRRSVRRVIECGFGQ